MGTDDGAEILSAITCANTELLVAIATGKINAKEVAKAALASRGMVANGGGCSAAWAGFDNAKKFWENY